MTQYNLIMAQLRNRLNLASERGVTAVEYGLLLVGIAVIIGAAALLLGGRIAALFNSVIPGP